MARKSRKNIQNDEVIKSNVLRTAVYIRLSEENGKGRSCSVDTQRQIIENFIAISPELEIYDSYIDNGLTGRHFERPEFKRMIEDVEKGKIDCIVCKDLSRLGRNSIDTGYYIEKVFPSRNVRFIAVSDNFDTATDFDSSNAIMLSLKNMINEAYSMDIGRKIKAQQEQAIKDGQYVGGSPPYGYLKDPNNCHKLIIDVETAPIVKQIFEMASKRYGLTAICRALNENKIITPTHYFQKIGLPTNGRISDAWQTRTITKMLSSEMYIGNMMQGKSNSINRKQTRKDKSEWIIIPNTHEPIISKELFDKVRKIRKEMSFKSEGKWSENIFKGKIFCADCGKNLHRQKEQRVKTDNKYFFHCISNYRIAKDFCNSHIRIDEQDLHRTVFKILEIKSEAIFGMSIQLKQKQGLIDKDLRKRNKELAALSEEVVKNQTYLKSLYENLVVGILDLDEYKALKQGYEEKIETARNRYFETETQIKELQKQISDVKLLDKDLKSASKKTILSREIVERLIDKIVVSDNYNIEIMFTFESAFPLVEEVLANE